MTGAGPGPVTRPLLGWLDCSAGVAGDMLLGALLDALDQLGLSRAPVTDAVARLGVGLGVVTTPVRRAGLAATAVRVTGTDAAPDTPHRNLAAVRALLAAADAPPAALRVFGALAAAEARVHGVPVGDVTFHEVGALDALADVVGVCAALAELQGAGLAVLTSSAVALGGGRVRGAHGALPVPVPAVLALLAGRVVHGGADSDGELATPTGAALLAVLCPQQGPLPALRPVAVGVGAGSRDPSGRANVVRLVVGEPAVVGAAAPTGPGGPDTAPVDAAHWELRANVDDLDPRLWPGVLAELLASGADDAWLTPVLMKKGRPASVVSVLCRAARVAACEAVLLRATSTLGVRGTPVPRKTTAQRCWRTVATGAGPVRVKVGGWAGRVVTVSVEFDDAAAAAAAAGAPVKAVLAEAAAAAHTAGLVVGAPYPPPERATGTG